MVLARISYKSSFDFPIAYVDTITIYDKIALRPVSFSALTYQIVLSVLRSGCLYRQLKHLANESHLVRQFVFGFTIGLFSCLLTFTLMWDLGDCWNSRNNIGGFFQPSTYSRRLAYIRVRFTAIVHILKHKPEHNTCLHVRYVVVREPVLSCWSGLALAVMDR